MKYPILIIIQLAAFWVGTAQSAEIPFDYYQGLIFFEIQTGQSDTLLCLFDSGAESSAIDDLTSDRLQLPVTDSTIVAGSDGSLKVAVVKLSQAVLGNYKVNSIFPTKRSLASSLSPDHRKLDMVLGYDFFQNAIVVIDFKQKKLCIFTDTAAIHCTSYINFSLDHNIPRFSGMVNGKVKMDFRLDTGASLFETNDVYINITTRDWQRLKMQFPSLEPQSYLYATGVENKPLQLPVVRLEKIVVGTFEVDKPYVIVQPEKGYFGQPDAVGFVSNNLLKNYRCIAIDYLHNRLYYSE